MAAPADAIFVEGEIHTLGTADRTAEAMAIRDGRICRVADTYEVAFLEGLETRRVDLNGRTVIPGFVDGYARLHTVGHHLSGSEADGSGDTPESVEQARTYLTTALDYAREQGITTVYDEVRHPETARAYHELATAEKLPIRVRLNYRGEAGSAERPTPLDSARTLGLVSDVGSDRLNIESLGIDVDEWPASDRGDFLERATETGFRVSATATGTGALDSLLSALESSNANRPRIWLAGTPSEAQIQALADLGATVVGRPGPGPVPGDPATAAHGGDTSNGPQFDRLLAAGVPVAFGSNGDRPDPLRAIEGAIRTGSTGRLEIPEALGVATGAGGTQSTSESEIGTLEVDTPADFAVLSDSPWETPPSGVTVEMTVVDGEIVYDSS